MTLRALLLPAILATALSASPAVAAPTVDTITGDTRVELSSTFLDALTSLGVTPSPSSPGLIRGTNAIFPIVAGEIDLSNAAGEIAHRGGLNLTAGATTVTISSFVIDTSGDAPVLTGLVKANDSLVARIELFDLALGSPPSAGQGTGVLGSLLIENVDVTLTDTAAAALNEAFGVTAFVEGIPVGTARVRGFTIDRD